MESRKVLLLSTILSLPLDVEASTGPAKTKNNSPGFGLLSVDGSFISDDSASTEPVSFNQRHFNTLSEAKIECRYNGWFAGAY